MPQRTTSLSDTFQEGTDAKLQGLKLDDNPYALATAEREEWKQGFLAKCDLDEEDDPASDRLKPGFD